MTETTFAVPATPTGLDHSRAWLLAAAPLLLLAVDAAFLYSGYSDGSTVSWVVALAVNWGIAGWDSHYLKSRGYLVPAGFALLLVPSYLWQRSSKLGVSQAPLVVWIAALVVSVAGTLAVESHFVTLNLPSVKAGIVSWAQKNGVPGAVVSCPRRSVYQVHDTFVCDLSDGSSTVHVLVTVENSSGYVTWETVG